MQPKKDSSPKFFTPKTLFGTGMDQISKRANEHFKTNVQANTKNLMYREPQYYRSYLSSYDPNSRSEFLQKNKKKVTSFDLYFKNSSKKKKSLRELMKSLAENEQLCKRIVKCNASGKKEYPELDILLDGLQEKKANLMPLMMNRNKKIPITSMSVKLMQPLTFNKNKHIHTSPLDSTLMMEKLKSRLRQVQTKSVSQRLLTPQFRIDPEKHCTRDNDLKLIQNCNLESSANSCAQRELYLGRTLYYEDSLKKEIEELLDLLDKNFQRYRINRNLSMKTKEAPTLNFEAQKQLSSFHSARGRIHPSGPILDLGSEEIRERLLKGSETTEDILEKIRGEDVQRFARENDIALCESDPETSFKLPESQRKSCAKPIDVPTHKKKIKTKKIPIENKRKEWTIQNLLFNNESQRLFGKKQTFVKKNTFSLIRSKKFH